MNVIELFPLLRKTEVFTRSHPELAPCHSRPWTPHNYQSFIVFFHYLKIFHFDKKI
ncbi:rCG52870 [Rattus norvegicus]|uniref:RCG52870 n=1 Tax=Rattus norvegicus TaxID=10116 RepID=A6IR37_RAT|nr:rCG52870 [Rattus norvegicus]